MFLRIALSGHLHYLHLPPLHLLLLPFLLSSEHASNLMKTIHQTDPIDSSWKNNSEVCIQAGLFLDMGSQFDPSPHLFGILLVEGCSGCNRKKNSSQNFISTLLLDLTALEQGDDSLTWAVPKSKLEIAQQGGQSRSGLFQDLCLKFFPNQHRHRNPVLFGSL